MSGFGLSQRGIEKKKQNAFLGALRPALRTKAADESDHLIAGEAVAAVNDEEGSNYDWNSDQEENEKLAGFQKKDSRRIRTAS